MAEEKKTTGDQSAEQNSSNKEQQNNASQKPYFDQANYNDDPDNMANYSGNFGTGTYDTDYGKGSFPDTSAKEQGDNWVNKVGNHQEGKEESRENKNEQQNSR